MIWRNHRLPRPHRGVVRVLGVVAACYLTALVAVNLSTSSYSGLISRLFPNLGGQATLDRNSIDTAWATIEREYVVRSVAASSGTSGAEQGMIQVLRDSYGDRFSQFLTHAQYQELQSTLGGVRSGSIGVALEPRCGGAICAANQAADQAVIEDVLDNQPADRAGVQRGDVLVAVDSHTLQSLASDQSLRIDKAASMVRGPVGTTVTLTLQRSGQQVVLSVTRANLQIPSVYSQLIGRTLYLQITGFDTDTGDAARAQLTKGLAAGATSVILDLRENGGGYVSAAQSLVSEFVQPTATQHDVVVRRGRLASPNDPKSSQQVLTDPILSGGVALASPLVVLVDGNSASAAEISAAALRDYHRASTVGQPTFGKGSVQVDYPLPDGADLHLTVERWYGPNGESIEGTGVAADHVVALTRPDDRFRLDAQSAPESADAQLQEALTLLR